MPDSIHDGATEEAGRAGRRRDWERRGLIGPIKVLTRDATARISAEFRDQYARSDISDKRNRHADLPVLAALCANPDIWWPAHEILGDELLLWRTAMFLDNPSLAWHEDHHARLFARDAFSISMLLAIEDSPTDNCTVFVPGSHRMAIPEKERRFGITAEIRAGGNVVYAGEVPAEFQEPRPLGRGEVILFHPRLVHASSGFVNRALSAGRSEPAGKRMSLAFRIASPDCVLRNEAFPMPHEDRDEVLRVISRSSGAGS